MNASRSTALYVSAHRLAAFILEGTHTVAETARPGRTTAVLRQRIHGWEDELGDLLRHAGHVPPQTVALRGADGHLLLVRLEYHPKSSTCLRSRGIVVEPAADVDLQAQARRAGLVAVRARGEDLRCRV